MTTLALWVLMNASIVADWGQTRYIATEQYVGRSGGKLGPVYREQGPAKMFLGSHPHRDRVDAYFIGSLLVNNGIMIALPKKYRPYYAGGVAAMEAYFVVSNNHIGIKIDF